MVVVVQGSKSRNPTGGDGKQSMVEKLDLTTEVNRGEFPLICGEPMVTESSSDDQLTVFI